MNESLVGLGILVCLFTGFGFWAYMCYKLFALVARKAKSDW